MDIITALNDIPTPDMSKFLMELWNNNPGDQIKVTYNSDREYKETNVILIDRP